MDIAGIEPSGAKSGVLVLVFKKIVWAADEDLVKALQAKGVVSPFKWSPRPLNTKVLALPWVVPAKPEQAQAQHDAVGAHAAIAEARGLAMPELQKFFDDDHGKKVPYLDGGELTVAVARCAPDKLDEVMTYLRAPQRQDWFMDNLADVARKTKAPSGRALIYDAIAAMPVPPKSNRHHATYVDALVQGAAAYRAAKDAASAERLEKQAAAFAKSTKTKKK
jgi:hypothetical protein